MRSVICVHERFDAVWPFAADYWQERWQEKGRCELYRTEKASAHASHLVDDPASVNRLVLLGFPADAEDLEPFTNLEECFQTPQGQSDSSIEALKARGISFIPHREDVYWGQSVAEFGLGLTISALRRIPQTYTAMMSSHDPWKYEPEIGKPGQRGQQYGDDSNFTNGTLAGAAFVVAGAERCFHLSELVKDSEIFVPMVPLTDSTRGLVTAELINALPHGSLVVQVTRAKVCDTEALYKRVLNDELSLAADVFDTEPLPLESPLLTRHNVVHTPHNAGRTIHANQRFAEDQMSRFRPR